MNVLTNAKAGIYLEEDLKDIPPAWRTKYFNKIGNNQVQVCEQMVEQPALQMRSSPLRVRSKFGRTCLRKYSKCSFSRMK